MYLTRTLRRSLATVSKGKIQHENYDIEVRLTIIFEDLLVTNLFPCLQGIPSENFILHGFQCTAGSFQHRHPRQIP